MTLLARVRRFVAAQFDDVDAARRILVLDYLAHQAFLAKREAIQSRRVTCRLLAQGRAS